MEKNHIRIVPLGGLGEIGKNMMVIEYKNEMIIVDVGLKFPDSSLLGVDLILPNFSYIRQNRKKLKAIFITHGHEDHIGGLSFLLRDIQAPVYGTRLSLGFIRNKLVEYAPNAEKHLFEIKPRESIKVGNFDVEFINVNHSVAGCVSLAIKTPEGVIIHTGDLKIDSNPVDNESFDYYTFSRYGEEGVLLLLSDSTNSIVDGYTNSESSIREKIEAIFEDARGRVIFATFASNIHRIQQVIDASQKAGRKIALSGLSMIKNVEMARNLGYLKYEDRDLLSLAELKYYPGKEITVMTTGTQGEVMSALTRIANQNHRELKIEPNDTIVISASVIPGNEKAVGKIVNRLLMLGAKLETDSDSGIYNGLGVHVSGHGSREELKTMINLAKPKFFIPIHGEYIHLSRHAKLAEEMNIPRQNILLALNGDIIDVTKNKIRKTGNAPAREVYVDGKTVGDVGSQILKERRALGENGIIVILLHLNQDWLLVEQPRVIMKGYAYHKSGFDIQKYIKELIEGKISDWRKGREKKNLENKLQSAVKRFFHSHSGRDPILEIEIIISDL